MAALTGNAAYAVGLYLKVQQRQRSVDRAEAELAAWVRALTPAEFEAYVDATTVHDARTAEEAP